MGFKKHIPEEINLDNEICNLKYFDQRKSEILIKVFFKNNLNHKDIFFYFDDAFIYVLNNIKYQPLINGKIFIDFYSTFTIKETFDMKLIGNKFNRVFTNSIFLKETMQKIVSMEGFHYFYLTLNK